MKVNINYKGKSVELDIPDEKLEELVKEQKKTGWEKPKYSEDYYLMSIDGSVLGDGWANMMGDNKRYEYGNCFTSKKLAENIARYQSLDLRIRRRIAEICEPVDLCDPNADKYTFYYDDAFHEIRWTRHIGIHFATWYCDTEANVYKIIEEFKDELIWYFTEFKDRMDG